ncbi:hypothetical protein GCM10010124_05790 [Pilimelia terevasa]|uniref:Methylamine utilisation protein MauE domain-containing protein n=1 Tax=Pilimelia terevasa TaxID=53372 RepID=A0A8J3FHV8_9ACTN|nr:hypothetical protein GCM10010124_05790 [Pilimelia terevasa]
MTGTPAPDRASAAGRWRLAQPWLTVLVRLGLTAVWLVAGGAKVGDLDHSGRVVHAYQLMPYDVAMAVGAVLPFVELGVGLLLLAGLATRLTAALSTAMLLAFVGGIIWAWSKGLTIDCGCFGGGGELAAGQSPSYLADLLRDAGFLAMSAFLLRWPRGWLAADNWLRGDPQLPTGAAVPPAGWADSDDDPHRTSRQENR